MREAFSFLSSLSSVLVITHEDSELMECGVQRTVERRELNALRLRDIRITHVIHEHPDASLLDGRQLGDRLIEPGIFFPPDELADNRFQVFFCLYAFCFFNGKQLR